MSLKRHVYDKHSDFWASTFSRSDLSLLEYILRREKTKMFTRTVKHVCISFTFHLVRDFEGLTWMRFCKNSNEDRLSVAHTSIEHV